MAAAAGMIAVMAAAAFSPADVHAETAETDKQAEVSEAGDTLQESSSADEKMMTAKAAKNNKKKVHWVYKKTKSGKKVKEKYQLADGSYATGAKKIGDKTWYFRVKDHTLATDQSTRILSGTGMSYLVGKDGSVKKGWQVVDNKLYYFGGKNGAMVKSKNVDKIWLKADGSAEDSLNANVRKEAVKTLEKATDRSKSKSAQLKDCYYYLTRRHGYSYAMIYPDLSSKVWGKKLAYTLLKNKYGNCYGYASGFSALADAIGYKNIQLVCGRISGSRDHAADHYTRHAYVKIDGRYYDPELHFAGTANIYARSSYPIHTKSRRFYSWADMNGMKTNIKEKKGSSFVYYDKNGNLVKNKKKKIDGSIYYFDKNGMPIIPYSRILIRKKR